MDARTSIKTIIEQDAAFCQDVSVTVCRSLPTVTIHDQSGINEDIFMQGDDADEFISAFDALVEQAPDVLFADALKHLALPWVEAAWD
jgi:hypothetical protein